MGLLLAAPIFTKEFWPTETILFLIVSLHKCLTADPTCIKVISGVTAPQMNFSEMLPLEIAARAQSKR